MKYQYFSFEYIYTDGSKSDDKVVAAADSENEVITFRLLDDTFIFSPELKATELAVDHNLVNFRNVDNQ